MASLAIKIHVLLPKHPAERIRVALGLFLAMKVDHAHAVTERFGDALDERRKEPVVVDPLRGIFLPALQGDDAQLTGIGAKDAHRHPHAVPDGVHSEKREDVGVCGVQDRLQLRGIRVACGFRQRRGFGGFLVHSEKTWAGNGVTQQTVYANILYAKSPGMPRSKSKNSPAGDLRRARGARSWA